MNPELTHCVRSCPIAKCWLMPGMATLTTVDDMIEAMVPTISDSSRSQR